MTDAERNAIVNRAMDRYFTGAFAREDVVRLAAVEIRQGFEALGATPDELAQFVIDYAASILKSQSTPDKMTAAIRAMADGFGFEVVLGKATSGEVAITVRPIHEH